MTHNSELAEKRLMKERQQRFEAEAALEPAPLDSSDRAPRAVRLRMILLLSIATWALIAMVIAALLG